MMTKKKSDMSKSLDNKQYRRLLHLNNLLKEQRQALINKNEVKLFKLSKALIKTATCIKQNKLTNEKYTKEFYESDKTKALKITCYNQHIGNQILLSQQLELCRKLVCVFSKTDSTFCKYNESGNKASNKLCSSILHKTI